MIGAMSASTDRARASGRVLTIDALRGFSLIGMVLVHFMIYFGNEASADTWSYFMFNHGLGDWGAAGFLVMMGASQVLSWRKHADMSERVLLKRALIRGGYIFAVGLLMLALAWGPFQIWQWDILTLMGFCTVLVFFCRKLPSWAILALAAAIAVCTPWLRNGLNLASLWGGDFTQVPVISRYFPGILIDPAKEYEVIWSFKEIARGFLLAGYFPVLPWSLFPMLGVVLGRRIVSGKIRGDLPWLAASGIALLGLGLGLAYAGTGRPQSSIIDGFVAPLSFYPDSFTMILTQTGLFLAVFSIVYFFLDVRRRSGYGTGPVMTVLIRTSGFSLSFYFMHYMLIGWSLGIIWLFTRKYYIADLMGSGPALLCGIAGLVLLEAIIYCWEKREARYSLEWFLVVLTNRFAVLSAARAGRAGAAAHVDVRLPSRRSRQGIKRSASSARSTGSPGRGLPPSPARSRLSSGS